MKTCPWRSCCRDKKTRCLQRGRVIKALLSHGTLQMREGNKKQLGDISVSAPSNFRHAAHIGREGARVEDTFSVETLPDDFVDVFLAAGMTLEELKNPKAIAFALSFIHENVGRFKNNLDERDMHLRETLQQFKLDSEKNGIVHSSLRLDVSELDFGLKDQVIGRGASCEVLVAMFHGTPVAVKRMLHVQTEGTLQPMEQEVAILTLMRHPNVVQCLGAALTNGQRPCVVLELMEGGSLADAIHEARRPLAEAVKLSMMRQIASALLYLHSRSPCVVHRDVKPLNILLDHSHERAKLTDFGISRLAQTLLSKSPTMNVGTPEYCAPEVFNPSPVKSNSANVLAKLDVYSFSITFWETMAAKRPFAECQHPMQVMFSVASGVRPSLPSLPRSCTDPLKLLLTRCWDAMPDQRPTMAEVLAILDPAAIIAEEIANDAVNDQRTCVICMEKEKSHILIPCGHLCVCEEDGRDVKVCPLCRAGVLSTHRVFQ
jgi:serine/threonine protein kinase